ncbi:MAG: carbohydrate ABC transporter permease [Dictyoglomaceae bacterium]|nr:carbohydrate ABC transporter permease [Thermodesulfovibrio sp.]MCX7846014.1 carbohydrate ABC transporter permease [Dictyoglomaceae bacterium]
MLELFKSKEKRAFLFRNLVRLILIFITFIYILPFIWMLSTSFKADRELYLFPPKWFPWPLVWENYNKALQRFPFFKYLRNSVIITGGSLLGVLISCPLVAYGFSKIRWKGRDFFFYLMLSTMMLPGAVTIIPTFMIFKTLGWINTYLPLIVPSFLGGGAGLIFLVRQFFNTIPDDLVDAARVDGAGDLQIYLRVILPLAKPVLFLISLFTFLGAWNNYFGPLIYLTDESKYPLALGLPTFFSLYGTYWNQMMACATMTVIPTIIFFVIAQRYLIEGIKITGIKE